MKKVQVFIGTVYIFLFVYGSVFAVGEKTISLGGDASWSSAQSRTGITEVKQLRPNPVLILSSAPPHSEISTFDLYVSFDENETGLFKDSAGNYRLTVPSDIGTASRSSARAGMGAAVFGRSSMKSSTGALVIQPDKRNALFAPGSKPRDFTIEFWMYPLNMENGEQVLSWLAAVSVNGKTAVQRIDCSISKNKLHWTFNNFFMSVNNSGFLNMDFTGTSHIVPKTWSHHLVRFDAHTGLLEYLVDGGSEAIVYATSSGRESSEVFTPNIGSGGSFSLGERYSGLIDELKIHKEYRELKTIQKYASSGGRVETRPIDLGDVSSGVTKVNVSGGRTGISNNSITNDYSENGRFRFADDSQMNFFIRASENPYQLNNCKWVSFTPGADINGISGRYVQIAVDFYPSFDGESSPYLDEINIVFKPGVPPLPPRNLAAVASDGGVTLFWRHSPNANLEDPGHTGYLVYYSAVRGELFGEGAAFGASPVDVGINNKVYIDGLSNGTLYYFKVAAYDLRSGYNIGVFSAEVTARPLAGLAP